VKGKKVKTLKQLMDLSLARKSILWFGSKRPMPAAFAISMRATHVHRMIEFGLYEYRSAAKQKQKEPA
jgi:hypothetical protein